jgi:alpha-tubulin suppressor-like RCC1 family protein
MPQLRPIAIALTAIETPRVWGIGSSQRVDVGLDNGDGAGIAGDGVLQAGEIDQHFFSCNGADGTQGIQGVAGDSCSVFNNCDGWSTVTCEDGSSATWWSGYFCSIAAGGAHNCALDAAGSVQCWGRSDYNQTDVPLGQFIQIDSGGYHTCGIKKDRSMVCWGAGSSFSATCDTSSNNFNCNQSRPPAGFYFKSMAAGLYMTCGITTTDTVKCWGEDFSGSLAPPSGAFTQVTAGYRFACGLRATGLAECWGSTPGNLGTIPVDTFKTIEAGLETVCGIKTDGSIKCWGSDAQSVISGAPSTGVFPRWPPKTGH